jgi:beta-lactamase class D
MMSLPGKYAAIACALLGFGLSAEAAVAQDTCTLLADAASGKVLSQAGECDRPVPPASTFKIPIALMGYDAGFLKDEHSPKLPFKEGYPDWIEAWRTDIDPAAWMKHSVVWYSQQITQALGKQKFAAYVKAFGYGNADVSGDPGKDNGLTRSWLSSSLRISPLEQADFLGRIVRRELPVDARAYAMTEAILTRSALANGWTVLGKTGAGYSVRNNKVDRNRPFGWYVGWATKGDRTVIFVRLSEFTGRQKMSPGLGTRDQMIEQLPAMLDAVQP